MMENYSLLKTFDRIDFIGSSMLINALLATPTQNNLERSMGKVNVLKCDCESMKQLEVKGSTSC